MGGIRARGPGISEVGRPVEKTLKATRDPGSSHRTKLPKQFCLSPAPVSGTRPGDECVGDGLMRRGPIKD